MSDRRPEHVYGILVRDGAVFLAGDGSGVALPGGAFPPLAMQMIAVGEDTGKLDEMLLTTADYFDREVRNEVKRLTSLLEPVMILVMGLVVGFMVISMLMA